jgi:hypothetical protein
MQKAEISNEFSNERKQEEEDGSEEGTLKRKGQRWSESRVESSKRTSERLLPIHDNRRRTPRIRVIEAEKETRKMKGDSRNRKWS